MAEPNFYMSILEYPRGDEVELVEFFYPADASWACIDCGDCCGDIDEHTRMIRLLPEDIDRIKKTGARAFFDEWDEGNFTGLMCKDYGKCVFYSGNGCKIYDHRALLCRMYPFWLEKEEDFFIFGIDHECSGSDKGKPLDEGFFADLLMMALKAMDY